jgi:uncharacterized protein
MKTIEKIVKSSEFAAKTELDGDGLLVSKDASSLYPPNRAITSNRLLSLIILPTENCNFRCTYCYEDFAVGRMKKEVIDGIKSLLTKRCQQLDFVSIEWFGGEPLVAKDIVLDISQFMMATIFTSPRLRYSSSMTTNAYLLNLETATKLSNVGVRSYQISLDGPKDIHDRSRLRADGGSTFDRIWTNLLAIRDSSLPVKITLRIHVAVDTWTSLSPLLADIKREFLPDSRFSVFFKTIERLGGKNDDKIGQFFHDEQEQVMNSLKNELFGENHNSLQNGDLPDDYICYASRPNSLIIRANGDVGKCTVALYDERNKIATLQPDGTMKVIPGRLAPWVRGLETLDPVTLACPLTGLPLENNKT